MNDLTVKRLLSHLLHLFSLCIVHLCCVLHGKNPGGTGAPMCYGDTKPHNINASVSCQSCVFSLYQQRGHQLLAISLNYVQGKRVSALAN